MVFAYMISFNMALSNVQNLSMEPRENNRVPYASFEEFLTDPVSHESQFEIRNKASLFCDDRILTARDLPDGPVKAQYRRWCKGYEYKLHEAIEEWRAKKLKEEGIDVDLDQACLRFLMMQVYHKELTKEKPPLAFSECNIPGALTPKHAHYYIDGTPIPGHTRSCIERLCERDKSFKLDDFPKVWRLNGYLATDFLSPPHSNGRFFNCSATEFACKWWKLAYSGMIPSMTYQHFFRQDQIVHHNQGYVHEEANNLERNLEKVDTMFKAENIWPFFSYECKVYLSDKLGLFELAPRAITNDEAEVVVHEFADSEVKVHEHEALKPGKIVTIEEVTEEEEEELGFDRPLDHTVVDALADAIADECLDPQVVVVATPSVVIAGPTPKSTLEHGTPLKSDTRLFRQVSNTAYKRIAKAGFSQAGIVVSKLMQRGYEQVKRIIKSPKKLESYVSWQLKQLGLPVQKKLEFVPGDGHFVETKPTVRPKTVTALKMRSPARPVEKETTFSIPTAVEEPSDLPEADLEWKPIPMPRKLKKCSNDVIEEAEVLIAPTPPTPLPRTIFLTEEQREAPGPLIEPQLVHNPKFQQAIKMYEHHGRCLFAHAEKFFPQHAGKIAGMLLELGRTKIDELLLNYEALVHMIVEAYVLLAREEFTKEIAEKFPSKLVANASTMTNPEIVVTCETEIQTEDQVLVVIDDGPVETCDKFTQAGPPLLEGTVDKCDAESLTDDYLLWDFFEMQPDSIKEAMLYGDEEESTFEVTQEELAEIPEYPEDDPEEDYEYALMHQEDIMPLVESGPPLALTCRLVNWPPEILSLDVQTFREQQLPSMPLDMHDALIQDFLRQQELWRRSRFQHFVPGGREVVDRLLAGADNEDGGSGETETTGNVAFVDLRSEETTSTHVAGEVETRDPTNTLAEDPWTLKQVLERWIFIETLTWDAATSTDFKEYVIPQVLWKQLKRAAIQQLKSYAYMRTAVEMKFQINGTKFHNGRLIIYIVPPFWDDDDGYHTTDNATCWPHIFLDASLNDSGTVHVPFIHCLSYFPQHPNLSQNDSMLTLGRVFVKVWNKLRYGEGASSKLNVTVWARFVNPEVHQTTIPITAFPSSTGMFGALAEGFGDSFVNALGRGFGGAAVGALVGGPAGGLVGGLSLGLYDMLKGIMSGVIFDKPRNPEPETPIVNRSAYAPCHGTGIDMSTRLALTNISYTVTTPGILGTSSPDMDIRKLIQLPCRVATIEWTTAKSMHTLLFSHQICPTYLCRQMFWAYPSSARYYPSMLAYVARAFCFWRGSIKFKIQIVSTMYHTGRLALIYNPMLANSPDQAFEDETNYNLGIFDIEEQKEFEVTIPFMSIRPWLRCDSFRHHDNFEGGSGVPQDLLGTTHCGRFSIYILNELVAPANVSTTVDMNVYFYAGPDMEFAVPNTLDPLNLNDSDYDLLGGSSTYPFTTVDTKFNIDADNIDYIMMLFYSGLTLYRQGYIVDGKDWWFRAQRKSGFEYISEVDIWLYKAGQIASYVTQHTNSGKRWPNQVAVLQRLGKFEDHHAYDLVPSVSTRPESIIQAGETMLSNRDESPPNTTLLKGNTSKEIAPYTMSENAMNLQTLMRRSYCLINAFPTRNALGYTCVQIPVSPTLCPSLRKPIGTSYGEARPIHPIAWFSRLFTWWRGSLRYKITFNNEAADVFVIHIPYEAYPFAYHSGVSETDIQRQMQFAGAVMLSHVQGSTDVEIPFFSPYNQLLIDTHGTRTDLRAQCGTMFIYFRNSLEPTSLTKTKPLTFSLFMSCGDDFVCDVLKAPPKVFEPNMRIGECTGSDFDFVRLPELSRNLGDQSNKTITPAHSGIKQWDKKYKPGYCNVEWPPKPLPHPDMPKTEGVADYFVPESVKEQLSDLTNHGKDFMANTSATLAEMKTSADTALATLEVCAKKVTDVATNVERKQTVEEITNTVTSIKRMLEKFTSPPVQAAAPTSYVHVATEIVAIGGVLINLRRAIEEPSLANFITLGLCLSALFSIMGKELMTGLFENVVNWLFPRNNVQGPSKVESGPADFCEKHEGTIITCVAIFGTVFYAVIFGAVPSWDKLKKTLKSYFESTPDVEKKVPVKDEPKTESLFNLKEAHFSVLGIKALSQVYDKIYSLVGGFINYALDRESPEYAAARIAVEYKERLLAIIKECDELEDEQNLMLALRDPMVNNRFYALYDECLALLDVTISDTKVSQRLYTTLSRYVTKVEKLLMLLHKNEPPGDRRYDPFCLCLHGDSGAGKSEIMGDFCNLIADVMNLPRYNRVYPKNISDAYWSGYKQQPIVIWDEFAQNRELDEVIPEFVSLKSSRPMMVNMADLKEKGRYFTSQALVLGTNVAYAHINTVREQQAYTRRRDVIVGFKLRPPHTPKSMAATRHRQYPNFEHVQFSIRDPDEDKPLMEGMDDMTLAQVNDYVRMKCQEHHLKQMEAISQSVCLKMPRGVKAVVTPPTAENGAQVAPDPEAFRERMNAFFREQEEDEEVPEDDASTVTGSDAEDEDLGTIESGNGPHKAVVPVRVKYYNPETADEDDEACEDYITKQFGNIEFLCDDSVELTAEEELERDLFLDATPFRSKCFAICNYGARKVKESRVFKTLTKFYNWCSDIITDFYNEHPFLLKAIGVLSLLVAVGGVSYALAGSKPAEEAAYDNRIGTHHSVRVKAIANAAYDSNPKARTTHRVVSYSQGSAEGSVDPTAADIAAKVHNAVHIISWHTGAPRTVRCFQLAGTIILVPRHFFNCHEEGDLFYLAHRVHNLMFSYTLSRVRGDDHSDWVLYDCGTALDPGKHLQKYFISEESLGKVRKLQCAILSVDDRTIMEKTFGTCESKLSYGYKDDANNDVYRQDGWIYYDMGTRPGQCGSLLVGFSTLLPAPGKILGFHTAGHQKKNEGFSTLITREALEIQLRRFDRLYDDLPVVHGIDTTRDVLKESRIKPIGDYSLVGVMPNKMCLSQPLKTCFRKTPWHDEEDLEQPPPKVPAPLKPFPDSDGNMISPLRLALQKYGHPLMPFPQRRLNKVEAFVTNLLQNKLTQHTGKRIFPIQEAVRGIPGLQFADPMNMKSSPGWPYQVLEKCKPGKWHLFDEHGNITYQYLADSVKERTERAKVGKRVSSVWRDCLKDELRPFEKAQIGKTRLFTIAPVDFTIVLRQYFLDFVLAFYNANTQNFFSAVGINPESFEWTMLYSFLAQKSKNCVAGDFKNFDGCIHPDLMELVVNVINNWYNDGEENATVRRTLMCEIIHTVQLVENCVYMSHKGNPSGNPITTVLNTMVNYFLVLLCFQEIYPTHTLDEFNQSIKFIAYGDDHLYTVPEKFGKFNFNSVKEVLAKYGISYTTDKKTDEAAPDFIPLDEATFLKRGFRKDKEFGNSFLLPTMSKDTINSFFYFYRNSDDVQEQLSENMRCSLNFAAFHGREYYNSILERWRKYMAKYNLEPIMVSFEEQVDIFHATTEFVTPNVSEPVIVAKRRRMATVESKEKFMKATNSKFTRALCAILEAPVYYACAAVGLQCKSENFERTDDRWAAAIPSGEGKSTLCKQFPKIFVDHDELLLPQYDNMSVREVLRRGLPWCAANAREQDFPKEDRRILLVHSADNTKRKLIGSFITHYPTFIRTNILGRLQQRNAKKMSFEERNTMLLTAARELEPSLFQHPGT